MRRAPQDVPWAGGCGDNSCMYSESKGGMRPNVDCWCLSKWATFASLKELEAALELDGVSPGDKNALRWHIKNGGHSRSHDV